MLFFFFFSSSCSALASAHSCSVLSFLFPDHLWLHCYSLELLLLLIRAHSQNHRMTWFGRVPKDQRVPAPLPQAGQPTTRIILCSVVVFSQNYCLPLLFFLNFTLHLVCFHYVFHCRNKEEGQSIILLKPLCSRNITICFLPFFSHSVVHSK